MAENEQPNPEQSPAPAEGQAPGGQEKPKIIVDDDWKAQARAEKEKLAEQAQAGPPAGEGAAAGAAGARPGARGGPRQLPPASFSTLVSSMVTQAFMALGGMEDPRTKRRYVDLDLAKYHIDTLTMLETKTQGNLTDEEKRVLDQGLYEVRMQYVNVAQHLSTLQG